MAVGIAIIEVEIVKYAFVSISNPTINIWWPRTIHPNTAVINKAINIESLPDIIHWLYLEIISLIKPKAGKIDMYASGCLRNQGKCWDDNKSQPLNGSKNGRLECRSEIIHLHYLIQSQYYLIQQ